MDDRPNGPDTEGILDSRPAGGGRPIPAPPLPDLAVGQVLGDYRLLGRIGAGGFSVVWRAEHVGTGDVVALKIPRVAEFVNHLRREALIASRFRDPQVVGIIQVRLDHDPPFLAIPYVEGANLHLPDQAPAPEEIAPAFRRFRKITELVARLHDAGFVHCDLKPGNVRFDPRDVCHLLDLGLARQQVTVRQNTTLRASVVSVTGEKIAGTLEYMAPEVLSGDKPEKASDVYALGVILHVLLCGRPPAFGVNPAELNPYLPPGATDFLRQTLHADPLRRLPTAGSLLPIVDEFVRIEERCLGRRNGHERRLVFGRRMRTLGRGIKVLGWTALFAFVLAVGVPSFGAFLPEPSLVAFLGVVMGVPFALIGFLLAVTTINAWILRIPEKTYKNRRGHSWWTFMMQ